MRVLVVGKHFPAVRGTRALQMFKVTGALHDLGVEDDMIDFDYFGG